MKNSIRKVGNQGMVTTTTGNDLIHDLVLVAGVPNVRTAVIRKIMTSNNTGANATLIFGTLDRQAIPVFVPLLPTLNLLNGFDAEWIEAEIPSVEFMSDMTALAAGRNGSIYVVGSVAGILVSIEVEEYGA